MTTAATATSPVAKAAEAKVEAGAAPVRVAAEKAEKLRLSKYEGISKDYFMVAVAVETFGAWGPEGLKFVKTVGQKYKS